MGKILKFTYFSLLALASIGWATSCNTSGCTDNHSAIPLAEFYSSQTGKSVTLDILQIRGIGAPGDSVMLEHGTSASQCYLPMRPESDTTSWLISYYITDGEEADWSDTITLNYDRLPRFTSNECGVMYFYQVKSVETTHEFIDSVAVVDPLITNIDQVSLKIYFNTQDDE